ncbi:cold-shock protein [Paenibacillus ferrarius]|uniref:cold-shock protein n=1 Tax=Paenibacillus ferrarius TaxID=1469647 RepID=UPI003D2E1464
MAERRLGIVKWFKEDKGYGRISLDGQEDNHVFVHFSEILPDPIRLPNGFRFLKEGQKVTFDLFHFPNLDDSERRTAKNVQCRGLKVAVRRSLMFLGIYHCTNWERYFKNAACRGYPAGCSTKGQHSLITVQMV